MRIERRYTKAIGLPYGEIEFRSAKSEIRNPDGSVVFSLDGFEVPANWSQVAADVLGLEGQVLQRGGGRAGVPRRTALHAGAADGGAEFSAVVQHRAALGLRHRRPGPGPFLRRPRDR